MLCMECDGIVAPSAWRGKVLLVNGKIIDECVKDGDLDHWHRASFSHAVAVAHAALRGRDVVAVIEDDAVSAGGGASCTAYIAPRSRSVRP